MIPLAGLRRRHGRFDEASTLLDQAAGHRQVLLEQAMLALDRGNARTALQLAERFLRRLPEHNRMERLAGLELVLRSHLALGNRAQAAATLEVLRLVAEGLSNRQIAARLHISAFTAKRHVQNILTRLDLPTRAAASTYAARQGLL